MPIIPQITPSPQATPQLRGQAVAQFQDFGAGQAVRAGEAMASAASVTGAIATQLQHEYNDAKIQQVDALAAEAVNKALHSPDGGYLNLVGEAAIGKPRQTKFEELQKELDRIGETLDNDTQRTAYGRMRQERMLKAQFAADRHEAEATRTFNIGSTKARGELLKGDAVNSFGTESYDANKAAFLDVVDRLVTLHGGGDDERKLAQQNALGVLHSDTIQSLVENKRLGEAQKLLADEGGTIDPKVRAQLQEHVRRATVDHQSFDAARWSRGMGGRLPEQIERLNQMVEGGHLPIEVRDAAETRLRAMERTDWEDSARTGNEAQEEAESYAILNRAQSYDDLPLSMRETLESSGREIHVRAWFNQGRQRVTTQEGIDLMLMASDDFLASVSRDTLQSAASGSLSLSDGKALLNEWDRVHDRKSAAAAGGGSSMPEGLVNMTVTRRMQELGYLDIDRPTTEGQRNRRDWVLERVKRDLRENPNKKPDDVIEDALSNTLTVDGKTRPMEWFTPEERERGVYVTPVKDVPRNQVNPDLVARRLEENKARNAATRAWYAQQPSVYSPPAMLPETTPGIVSQLATETHNANRAREAATDRAMRWLKTEHVRIGRSSDPTGSAWDNMPQDLRDAMDMAGASDLIRVQWEGWTQTHDFLGRANRTTGAYQDALGRGGLR